MRTSPLIAIRTWLFLGAAAALLSMTACSGCLELETPREYPCTQASEAVACPSGWRCGLEEFCHPVGVAGAYACKIDLDCEGGWRCGPDAVCVDPSQDALRSDLYIGALVAERLNPRFLSPSTVSKVSVSRGADSTRAHSVAILQTDGGVVHLRRIPVPGRPLGAASPPYVNQISRVDPDGGVRDVAELDNRTLIQRTNGVDEVVWPTLSESGLYTQNMYPVSGRTFRTLSSIPAAFASFDDDQIWTAGDGADAGAPAKLPNVDSILDLTAVPYSNGHCLIAAGDRGLYYGVSTERGQLRDAVNGNATTDGGGLYPFELDQALQSVECRLDGGYSV
jgi:hypothetical protein